MKIGSLYTVHMFYWLLFPTKDALTVADLAVVAHCDAPGVDAAYLSRAYNCEVTCFSPDSIIVFLEEDGKYKKVLTSDGKIGWTWFDESYNECFEEVKTEQ